MKRLLALVLFSAALTSCGGIPPGSNRDIDSPTVEYIHPADLG